MKRFANAFSFAILALFLIAGSGCLSNPFKSRKTTVFGTIIYNTNNMPLDSNEVTIWGVRGSWKPIVEMLQTVRTDKNGKYTITLNVPERFYSVNVEVQYDFMKYKGFFISINGQRTNNCCMADIGLKTQYDFIMIDR